MNVFGHKSVDKKHGLTRQRKHSQISTNSKYVEYDVPNNIILVTNDHI
jgi:hypothetical protein